MLKEKTWTKELDIYPDLISAIIDGLYKKTDDILVVDFHQHSNFYAHLLVNIMLGTGLADNDIACIDRLS